MGIWSLLIIGIYGLLQSETEQRPHKVSFYVDKSKAETVTKQLSEILKNRGVRIKFVLWVISLQNFAKENV